MVISIPQSNQFKIITHLWKNKSGDIVSEHNNLYEKEYLGTLWKLCFDHDDILFINKWIDAKKGIIVENKIINHKL